MLSLNGFPGQVDETGCRLLFRVIVQTQNRMLKLVLALTPAWKRHLNSNVILEQDVGLITSQEDHFARGDQRKEIKDVFLPIRSSDTFVVAYRKWLDRSQRKPDPLPCQRTRNALHCLDFAVPYMCPL